MDTLTDVSAGSWVDGGEDLSGTSGGVGVGHYCNGMLKLEALILCSPNVKNCLIGKDLVSGKD